MSEILPFRALRPFKQFAEAVATKPYDVVNGKEIREESIKNPLTFFKVTRAELEFDQNENPYSDKVYSKAKENLDKLIFDKILFVDDIPCFYIYELIMNGRSQTGIVALSSVEEYRNGAIKKHEHTILEKENDRINHMLTVKAQTGNVFLAYNSVKEIDSLIAMLKDKYDTEYNFMTQDGVEHKIWVVKETSYINEIKGHFKNKVDKTYIADGHHRAASASKVDSKLNTEKSKYFLTTLFPSNQLNILDYNRIVKDLNSNSEIEFIDKVSRSFFIEKHSNVPGLSSKYEFGMYLNHEWYRLSIKKELVKNSTIESLSVSMLQDNILGPILNIRDPRNDHRINFVGGIKGYKELVKMVDSKEFSVAFMVYPVSMNELFLVANKNEIMPPKSTWFEPKLRDGLLTNLLL